MKKMNINNVNTVKKGLCLLLILLLSSSIFIIPAFASNPIEFSISTANAAIGEDAAVNVSLGAGSNAVVMQFAISYDVNALSLKSATGGSIVSSNAVINKNTPGVVIFAWDSTAPLTQGGNLLELVFTVQSSASVGASQVILAPDSVKQFKMCYLENEMDYINISCNKTNGAVNVTTDPTGVEISGENSVVKGSNLQLTAKILPLGAQGNVSWSVSDITGHATIDSTGLLSAVSTGTVKVKASLSSSIFEEKLITITPLKVSSVVIQSAGNKQSIAKGETLQMSVSSILPAGADDKSYTWQVSDGSLAQISSSGLLTGLSIGSIKVSAISSDGGNVKSNEITISITPKLVSSVIITSAGNVSKITQGQKLQMSASVLPADADNKQVTWSIENGSGTATIDQTGLLSAVSAGSVKVNAVAKDASEVNAKFDLLIIPKETVVLSLNSAKAAKGCSFTTSVKVSANSHISAIQFAVIYDPDVLSLNQAVPVTDFFDEANIDINTQTVGVVTFSATEIENSMSDESVLLNLNFTVPEDTALNDTIVSIYSKSDNNRYELVASDLNLNVIELGILNADITLYDVKMGDIGGDDKINILDVMILRQYCAEKIELTEAQVMAADVTGDEVVNILDVLALRKYCAGQISSFPVNQN